MKYIVFFFAVMLSIAAQASVLQETKSRVMNGETKSWEYEFYFSKPPSKDHGAIHIQEFACKKIAPGAPDLMPLPRCFDTQAEAFKAAKKEADLFERNCRINKECDLGRMAEMDRKKGKQ